MHLTLELRLLPSAEQRRLLLATMERFNAAASYAARIGFAAGKFSQPTIHKLCYQDLRSHFGISAQMAVRAIGKAVECFRRAKQHCPRFKPHGAMTYDERFFSFKGVAKVSLLTLAGRQLIPMIYGEYQQARFDRLKGQVDLIYRQGQFYLLAAVELPDDTPIRPKAFLGVDLGVANLATTSEGERFAGDKIESVRRKYHRLRRAIQKAAAERKRGGKRPRSMHRALGRTRGRESRFRRDTNHIISKKLVLLAKDSGRGIALEDLTGIRDRTRFRQPQRANDQLLAGFITLSMPVAELARFEPRGQPAVELIAATLLRQVYELAVNFWTNHFNTFIRMNQTRFLKLREINV